MALPTISLAGLLNVFYNGRLRAIVIRPEPARRDDLIAELWAQGTLGILEDDSQIRAYFPESTNVSGIITPENGEVIECLLESDTPGYGTIEANSEPVFLGQRFVVLDRPVSSCDISSSRAALLVPAGQAFGSGRHESTQLMVEAMEAYLHPGKVVIDVGCGSGILSKVARHLGAGTVIACDTHTDAIATARKSCSETALLLGSVDALDSSIADVVLANISAKIVDVLAADLVRVAKPGGLLLLSGFIQDRTPERFQPEAILERNGWLCWVCRPQLLPEASPEANGTVQPFEAQWW